MSKAGPARNSLHKVAAIRASALIPMLNFATSSGDAASQSMSRHGFDHSLLNDPYRVVSLAHYVGLFEDLSKETGEPNLGLKLGMRIRPADMGPMGVLFSLSPTMRDGFGRLCTYVRALQGGTYSSFFDVADNMIWTYRLADMGLWPRRQDAEYTMAAVCQLVRSCFAADWRPVEVHFEHEEEADKALLHRVFRAPVLYGQTANRFVVAREDANRIFRSEDGGLVAILERHIADLMGETPDIAEETLSERVRALVAMNLGQRAVDLASVARELGMSPRSLQRQLLAEGTSMRDVIRSHRVQLASRQLGQKRARIAEVAESLGYADGTVLWRAYKKWTGEGPKAGRLRENASDLPEAAPVQGKQEPPDAV